MRPEDNAQNADRCLCPGCPTYDDCMKGKGEKIFCSRGETECGPAPNGCICPECPVWMENKLKDRYYCVDGAAS